MFVCKWEGEGSEKEEEQWGGEKENMGMLNY